MPPETVELAAPMLAPKHNPFAVARWHRRNPDIHSAPRYTHRNTAILGQAFFCDIKFGHDFDTRYDQWRDGSPGLQHFLHDAIYSEADY